MKHLSRRDFVRITAASAAVLAAGGLGLKELIQASSEKTYTETRELLGTYITISIVDEEEGKAKAAAQDTFAEIERLSAVFSRFDATAELYRLNSSGHITGASTELTSVLERARSVSDMTGGAFDVTVLPLLSLITDSFEQYNIPPDAGAIASARALVGYKMLHIDGRDISLEKTGMAVTLDGIAKGYITDQATALLRSRGYSRILVQAGGELALQGMRQDGAPWKVGVTHPRALEGYYEVLQLTNACLGTSGDYENSFTADYAYNHIIDPVSGISPAELASATVIAADNCLADALSVAAMVMGTARSLNLFETLPNVQALLIGKDMKSRTTSGFNAAAGV